MQVTMLETAEFEGDSEIKINQNPKGKAKSYDQVLLRNKFLLTKLAHGRRHPGDEKDFKTRRFK